MTAKINEKALEYMQKEGIPYRVLKDGKIEVDSHRLKRGQFNDLTSILKTGTYPGENKERKVTRRYYLNYIDGTKLMKTWNEEKDGPWPYHPDSVQVSEYVDQWLNPHQGECEEVTKETPEEKLEDVLVITEDELPVWLKVTEDESTES